MNLRWRAPDHGGVPLFRRRARRERDVSWQQVMDHVDAYTSSSPPSPPSDAGIPRRSLIGLTTAGQPVTERSTLAVTAAWRAVNLISSTIGALPIHTYDEAGRINDPPIIEQPNPLEDRVDTISAAVACLLLHGNWFAPLAGLDDLGFPSTLNPLHPTSVLLRPVGGQWTFEVPGLGTLERSEVLWVRGITLPGRPLGLGVIDAQAATVGHALALNAFARTYFTDSPVPPGIIQTSEEMDREEAKELQEDWVAMHAGSRAPAVLSGGATFSEFGLSAEQLQFIQSRQLSAAEVAVAFGVPPYFVGAPSGDSMTYSNVEGDALHFVRWGLMPWIVRLERALTSLLPPGEYVKFQLGGLLRGTTSERYTAYQTALSAGFMTIDEVRALEDLPPLPKDTPNDAA